MRTAALYALSALVLWFVLRWATHMDRYELLASHGVEISGTITSRGCGNHMSFTYKYLAQGQSFAGSGKQSSGGVLCEALLPGQSVPVSYLASSPSVSVAGKPEAALSEARLFTNVGALFFPAVALWLVGRARRRQESVA